MVWNNYKGRNVELPLGLSEAGNDCVYVNPVKYKNWENESMRLHDLSSHSVGKIKVIERHTYLRKSLLSLIYENYANIKAIKENKPDTVVSFDHLMSLFACIYCKLKRIPFVFDVIDDWEAMEKNAVVRFYYKYIIKPIIGRFSYAITSTSYRQVEEFSKYNKKVFYVPNGKSIEFIKQVEAFSLQNGESNTVNFISTLRNWYDFDLLFDVFKEFPELQLNIYGLGELFDSLKTKAKNYANIHIMGNTDSEKLPKMLSESLFGILPLRLNKLNDSTCPIKLFDYWSAQKVVIASPTYEMKRMAEGGGIILASTREEYIQTIKKLLDDRVLAKSTGERGYNRMIATYNYNAITTGFKEVLAINKEWN